jgi:Regulator of ribonuclease activity B
VPLFRRKNVQEIDPNERAPQTGVKYKDLLILGQLIDSGAELTQPRHVLHYVYVPSPTSATAAADEARAYGFEATVKDPLPAYPDQWLVLCERHDAVLDPEYVRTCGDWFEALAERHGGEYDGWEAAARP